MHHLTTRLNALQRPKLLVQAALSGLASYRRETHLGRALGKVGHTRLVLPPAALEKLLELETALNTQRRDHDTGYQYARHVEVLIAIMGEAQLLRDGYCRPIAAE